MWVLRQLSRATRTSYSKLCSLKQQFIVFFFLFGLSSNLFGFELRASHLLGRSSGTWTILPALFCVGYFKAMVSRTIFRGWIQTLMLLISASQVAMITRQATSAWSIYCLAVLFSLENSRGRSVSCLSQLVVLSVVLGLKLHYSSLCLVTSKVLPVYLYLCSNFSHFIRTAITLA
jgi:hypothetical protein